MNEAEEITGRRIGLSEEDLRNWNPESNFGDAMRLFTSLKMTARQTKKFITLKIPSELCVSVCRIGDIEGLMKNIVHRAAWPQQDGIGGA